MVKRILFFLLIACYLLPACAQKKVYTDPEGPVYSGDFSEATPSFQGTLKVVSYNIKLAERVDDAIAELGRVPELSDADIVLLQEMDAEGTRLAAEALGCNFVYYPAVIHVKSGKPFGNAIMSRWPIVDHRKLILPYRDPVRENQRIAAVAVIAVDGMEIIAYSVHTEMVWLDFEKRLAQADSLVRSIAEADDYVIVGGDFNTETEVYLDLLEEMFERAGFLRASEGIGPTARGDPFGIIQPEFDHIFVKGMEVLDKGASPEAQASDHLPIWVKLKPK
jgi:endonuclease/exonuclease/phosphatase family metal-dependent hydrolase